MSIDTDVAIVGGGPAGLSAATWLARHRRSAVVVDSSEYRNRWVDSSHGYLGNDPTSPDELRAAAHRDLARYDSVRVVADRVTTVTADGDAFTVQLQQAGRMTFSRLILATGVADQFPSVSRFFDHYGRSVFHCPSCDGYETRGEPVVVIGWSPDIAGFAAGLLEWASSVTVVTDRRRFEGDSRHRRHLGDLGVAVLTDEVIAANGARYRRSGCATAGCWTAPSPSSRSRTGRATNWRWTSAARWSTRAASSSTTRGGPACRVCTPPVT